MSGKWNIKISGLKINTQTIPVVEIYFNLGYAVGVGDILNFGTIHEFGLDMQIRMNTIGDNWSYAVSAWIKKPTDIVFSNFQITDNSTGIQFIQQGYNFSNAVSSTLYMVLNGYYLAFSGNPSSIPETVKEGWSPLIVLHDTFANTLIGATNNQFGSPRTWGTDEGGEVTLNDGYGISRGFPVSAPSSSTSSFTVGMLLNEPPIIIVNPSDSDPYNPNGEHAGGDGENQNSDEMSDETLPTISAADTGFVTLYKPSISQMNALANYMWNTLDLDVFKKVIANPMDVILGLSILPGIVPSGGSSSVRVGNIDTGVSMTKVGNQYVKFNCGSVTIKRKWGAFLDYSPFTKAFIYLPFIGIEPIDVDEIMNKTVSVTYNIDVLSGGCCAFIKVNGTTLYSYIGQCACSVPVTGKDWSTMINGVLGAVSSIGGTIGSIASGNVAGAISGVAAVAQNVMGAKPSYQRSGTMGGMGGMMGIKTPYIIIERPVQAVPGYQNQIIGYPSFITRLIGDFKGYTEIEQCHLENIPCTEDELIEIENMLKTGVIL